VYCPRCGTQAEPGDRFCSACGASLPGRKGDDDHRSLRENIASLIGTTRRARAVTVITVLAIAAAIAAFVALPAKHGIPRDAYTIAADNVCVNAKKQIGAAGVRAFKQTRPNRTNVYASDIVLSTAEWRSSFDALSVPPDRTAKAQALDSALRNVEIAAAGLALAAQRRGSDVVSRARALGPLTAAVERDIAALGLTKCAQIVIAPVVPRAALTSPAGR
jgi:predicted nucleic acid-binding Zn ribbon protein